MVEIPETLIKRLQGLGPHFTRVSKRGKEPIDKKWQKNPMRADDPKLLQWLSEGGNYGVVCGFGLAVLDADHPEIQKTVKTDFPPSFTVESPGHKSPHYYFISNLTSKMYLQTDNREHAGEILWEGFQVVGPNSVHPNGGIYKIVNDTTLATISREQLEKLLGSHLVPEKQITQTEEAARREKREIKIDLDILQVVPLAGLKKQGNEFYGPHPVPSHGSTTGRNFWVNPSKNCWHCFRCGTGGGPLLWLAVEEGIIQCDEAGTGALRGEIFKKVLEKARNRGLIKDTKDKQVGAEYFDDHGKFIPKLLADDIMGSYSFVTMMDNEEICIHLEGYYQPLGEVLIKKECKDRLLEEYRKNRATEVIDYIKASTYTRRREEPPNLVPLENGVLDLYTMELKPYSPDLMFFNKVPVKYDPKAVCPNIEKFHREITGSEEDVTVLEEVLGFCLYRDYFIAKALMLVGGGSNAKSTWLSLAKTFLGQKNVCGRSLQDLEEHRFAKADLHAKLANIYADLPDKALFRTGMFKMLTGRDLIAAEKKFRNAFHFVNYAKLMFSANKVPEAYDDTVAFFRRWIIIVFPNVFTGEDADPQILEKLTTEEELSGLLNLALAGLKQLLEKGEFSYSKTTEEIKEDYVRKSSPIAAFVMDCLENDSDAFIVKKELFNVFTEYCRQLSLPTVTQDTFFKNLPQHATVMDYRPSVENKRYYTFKGIRYKLAMSNLSTVSRVFYTLIEKRGDYEDYEIEELDDNSFIKVGIPLDRVDSLDTKLKKIRAWIVDNKDSDGLIDSMGLAEKITRLGEKPQEIVNVLKEDSLIADSPKIGKWLVVK